MGELGQSRAFEGEAVRLESQGGMVVDTCDGRRPE